MNPARLKEIAYSAGASAAGIAPARALEAGKFSEAVKNAPAGLSYLRRDTARRQDIRNWYAGARSALVCAFSYWGPGRDYAAALAGAGEPLSWLKNTGRKVHQPALLLRSGARISRYALGPDYHIWVKDKLSAMLASIRAELPGADGKIFCDTSPVMEKELARLAGLGFAGRNTLLISEALGSWFFIGGIALNFEAAPDSPPGGSCGDCRACERACPTGALAGGALDASRCISYWTTQAREPVPAEIGEKAGGWAYGCDLCQEACPYNK